jgi:hypothetical protein
VVATYDDDHATSETAASAASANPVAATAPAPEAPTAPLSDVAEVASSDGIRVYWTPPIDNGGAPISGYVVTVYADDTELSTHNAGPNATFLLVDGLDTNPAIDYTFTVSAVNAAGTGPASEVMGPVSFVAGPPAVVSHSPGHNETGVAPNTNIVVQFSEEVTGWDGGAATLRRVSNGDLVPVTKSYAGSQLTLDPDAPLEPGEVYQVTLGTGIKTTDGRSLQRTQFRFTTSAAPPIVVSTAPADGDTGVGIRTGVRIYFSEEITGASATAVTLTRLSDGVQIPITRSYFAPEHRLFLNPFGNTDEALEPGTEYRVSLAGGSDAIRSLGGIPLETMSFTFTTAGDTPPSVVSTDPEDGNTNVAIGAGIRVDFSQPITGASASAVTLTRVADGAEIPITRGYHAPLNRLILNPYGSTDEKLEPGTEYRVTLTGGPNAIRSLAGVPLSTTSFTFTTAGDAPPTVVSTDPSPSEPGVPVGSGVRIYFSQPIQGASAAAATLTRVSDGEQIPVTRSYHEPLNRLYLNPYGNSDQGLDPNTEYRVTLVGGAEAIRSLGGVPLTTTTFTFTTGS